MIAHVRLLPDPKNKDDDAISVSSEEAAQLPREAT